MDVDRKRFLTGSCALAAVSALSGCEMIAARKPTNAEIAPVRGHGKLSLAFAHVKAGAERPFSVLHISDTHLTAAYPHEGICRSGKAAERTATFGGRQEESLRESIAWAKANADFILHTGDLIDYQSEANFDLVKKYFGTCFFGSVGNHEYYTYLPNEIREPCERFKDRSRALLTERLSANACFGSRVINGVNMVWMDDVFGTVTPGLVERFHAETKKKLPMVLAVHVPFFTPEVWRVTYRYWHQIGRRFDLTEKLGSDGDFMRQQNDQTTCEFIGYLKTEKLLKAVLAGHEHLTFEEQFSPTARQYLIGGNYNFCGREVLFT